MGNGMCLAAIRCVYIAMHSDMGGIIEIHARLALLIKLWTVCKTNQMQATVQMLNRL